MFSVHVPSQTQSEFERRCGAEARLSRSNRLSGYRGPLVSLYFHHRNDAAAKMPLGILLCFQRVGINYLRDEEEAIRVHPWSSLFSVCLSLWI